MSDPFKGRTTDQRAGEMGDFFRSQNAGKGDFLKKMLDIFVAPGRWIDENIVNPQGMDPMDPSQVPPQQAMSQPPMSDMPAQEMPQMAAPQMPPQQMAAPQQPAMAGAYDQPQTIEEVRRKLQRVPF